jgi:MFS family permease
MAGARATLRDIESPYAWWRLAASLAMMTLGCAGMYSVAVVLPAVQAEFAVARGDASLPYTMTMAGFGIGGVLMGRLTDRYGVMATVLVGAVGIGTGFVAAGYAASLWQFSLASGVLIGLLGASASFAPLVADTSMWFTRRRGIAVAICTSGMYLSGTLWPPLVQHFVQSVGWRQTYVGVGLACFVAMLPLSLMLAKRPPQIAAAPLAAGTVAATDRPLGMAPAMLLVLLSVASFACCVAMGMPQVHIVAYCSDLGFGAARGAEMLSLMLVCGIASRLFFGWVSDRIGGLRTLLTGSVLQCLGLLLFLPFDGLASLYAVSAFFGLSQGGIIPAYALIVREHFAAATVGARVGAVLMATLIGMALGGWLSGAIFDWTGSYRAAFYNGIGWNLLNIAIIAMLLLRAIRGGAVVSRREAAVA